MAEFISPISGGIADHSSAEGSIAVFTGDDTLPAVLQDRVGDPDFQELAQGKSARREHEATAGTIIPNKADIFIPPDSVGYPIDFEPPAPYFLNAQEWTIYTSRKEIIDARIEKALIGTNVG